MRRSSRLAEKQANLGNDACKEPKAKKHRLNDKTTKIATIDNGTMVEAFKYLDYSQLAKKSLVSKRFRNERAKCTNKYIKMFNKVLSPEEYDEWVIDNHYSKQVPLENQVAGEESTHSGSNVYKLYAYGAITYPNHSVEFFVRAELNHENWPLFQHFKLLSWIKDHVCCNEFSICGDSTLTDSSYDQELLTFLITGAHCTSAIYVRGYDLTNVVIDFVKKFMDCKNCEFVQSICSGAFVDEEESRIARILKREYPAFILKEEHSEEDDFHTYVFAFNNVDIGKKIQLTIKFDVPEEHHHKEFQVPSQVTIENLISREREKAARNERLLKTNDLLEYAQEPQQEYRITENQLFAGYKLLKEDRILKKRGYRYFIPATGTVFNQRDLDKWVSIFATGVTDEEGRILGLDSWQLFDEQKNKYHMVTARDWYKCSCPIGVTKSPCKHIVHVKHNKNELRFPAHFANRPLDMNRKVGRPKKNRQDRYAIRPQE
ncbi:hypothetical protein DdX_20653 [Ditylenchus destructor]|uniref:SWIM-type domain-containing protein n=1 Tax=Ditylenchus destructor TaxID=166010 RepID=A0AAD4QVZ2_9BILA|nr:hypothetical protein DdX_20653 [Ditylenchus destructor]